MKKLLSCLCGLCIATVGVQATPIFSDTFTYPDGNLAGNDGWTQLSTTTTTPIQVLSGQARLGPSGQDVYNPNIIGGPINLNPNTALYMSLDLTVSTAQTGDYFLHFTPAAGNTSAFADRLYVKSTTGGYLLGWAGSNLGAAYGAAVLTLGQTYHVVTAYNVSTGPVGGVGTATGAIYVDPTDPTIPNNTPYFSGLWAGGIENDVIGTVNFRQGSGTAAATLAVDNLTLWTEPIPEPATLSLLGGFGLLAWFIRRRR